jgi:hypothetical protein
MKRITFALLASVAALAASTAHADTRVSIGVNLGGPAYRPAPPAVVYAPPPTVVYAPAPVARGYWKDVTVKTWVPERVVWSRDRWGRSVRVCEPGYFTYRTDRVWVDGRDHDGPRGHAYGYDNRGYDRDYRGGWNR